MIFLLGMFVYFEGARTELEGPCEGPGVKIDA